MIHPQSSFQSHSHASSSEIFRNLPKADLHCHLDGSLRPSTLQQLSIERAISLPVNSSDELAQWMRVDDAANLEDYLARFAITLSVMQTVAELERIAYEFVLDAAHDGVRYIECRFCPALCTREGLTSNEVVEAVVRGLVRGENESGTVARVIVCALRSMPMPHAMEMAELAVAWHGRGVVAFDIAGAEHGNSATQHLEAFSFVRRSNMAVTIHAGEAAGAASIAEAIHECGANRIGHGTRLFEDPALEAYVVDRRIALEVCPTSNVQTRAVTAFSSHPLTRYNTLGAVVTINTDNRLMSGVNLSDEFAKCRNELGLTTKEIATLAINAFDSSFLPWEERRTLRSKAAEDMLVWLDRANALEEQAGNA